MINNAWPPEYTIRKSKRAKSIRLTVSLQKGIEVVLPYYATKREASMMVDEHRDWITQQLTKINSRKLVDNPDQLPKDIFLRCIDQLLPIEYIADDKRCRLNQATEQQLLIRGDINIDPVKKVLHKWLKKQAQQILTPWLDDISHEIGLAYNGVTFRKQTTLWGSCSHIKKLNLNYKLLFLPAKLVENVILHELCHTVHMNHSAKFWQLMQHYNKDAEMLDQLLKKAQKYIPAWVEG